MSSMRENPIRRTPSQAGGRPRWLIVLLVIVGVLVVIGVVYSVVSLTRSSEPTVDEASASAAACVSVTSIPQETLPPAKKVKIRVLNATRKQGLARTAADALSESGFTIKAVSNDTVVRKQSGVAEIRYGPKGRRQALLLQYYLPGAELVPDTRKGVIVDVALGEAFTSVATRAEADLALQTPVITQTGVGCPSPSVTSGSSSQLSQPAAPTVEGGAASE